MLSEKNALLASPPDGRASNMAVVPRPTRSPTLLTHSLKLRTQSDTLAPFVPLPFTPDPAQWSPESATVSLGFLDRRLWFNGSGQAMCYKLYLAQMGNRL